jgi:hypothetical protein
VDTRLRNVPCSRKHVAIFSDPGTGDPWTDPIVSVR